MRDAQPLYMVFDLKSEKILLIFVPQKLLKRSFQNEIYHILLLQMVESSTIFELANGILKTFLLPLVLTKVFPFIVDKASNQERSLIRVRLYQDYHLPIKASKQTISLSQPRLLQNCSTVETFVAYTL